jgi:hypothetical protein
MKHKLRIRIGNLSGQVETEYPVLMREIAKFPRGKEYLAYIDGYAISRYRTQPQQGIGRMLDAAFALLTDSEMPDKPLYVDELGDLSGDDSVRPFAPASGLAGAHFVSVALERIYRRQDGTPRSPRGVAFWRDEIAPRPRDTFNRPEAYLNTPTGHVIGMFAALRGAVHLPVAGPAYLAIAGASQDRVTAILLAPANGAAQLSAGPVEQARSVTIEGLEANTIFAVRITEVGRVRGNPISAFLEGAPGLAQDGKGRFTSAHGEWKLASPHWQACYFEEDASCAWRRKAREIEVPAVRVSRVETDAGGKLRIGMKVDTAAIVMVEVTVKR